MFNFKPENKISDVERRKKLQLNIMRECLQKTTMVWSSRKNEKEHWSDKCEKFEVRCTLALRGPMKTWSEIKKKKSRRTESQHEANKRQKYLKTI